MAHSDLFKEFLEYTGNMVYYEESADDALLRMSEYDRYAARRKPCSVLDECASLVPIDWCFKKKRI